MIIIRKLNGYPLWPGGADLQLEVGSLYMTEYGHFMTFKAVDGVTLHISKRGTFWGY